MKRNDKIKIAVASVVFLTGGFLVFKYMRDKKKGMALQQSVDSNANSNNPPVPVKQVPAPASSAASVFPLKVGSKNDKVSQLQAALGVSADGAFGPKTATALKEKTGLTQINSQAQLDETIKKLAILKAAATMKARAESMYSQFLQGKSAIQAIVTTRAQKVIEDTYGALQPAGNGFNLNPSYTYNNSDYKISGVTKLGKLILKVTRGDLAGTYLADPTNLTLVTV